MIRFTTEAPESYISVLETELDDIPQKFTINNLYPNPFNPTRKIQFSLPQASQVKIVVYNVLGQQIAELVNDFRSAGTYNVFFLRVRLPTRSTMLIAGLHLIALDVHKMEVTLTRIELKLN